MKISILGGSGTRVPLVMLGLLRFHDDLDVDELALWDVNREREPLIVQLCEALTRRYQIPIKVRSAGCAEEALEGSRFVLCSIRVGGTAGRITDETIALAEGTLGQETVGAGGWAMALRTIPPMLDYGRLIERVAPDAWLLNFTNPVGIILQAMQVAGIKRVIGVCDTPREMFEGVARELKIQSGSAFFDYFGLNHLGWLRRVVVNGEDRLAPLFTDPARLRRCYHLPLFEPDFLQQLGLLPTEYVYFYYRAQEATEKIQREATTRGRMVAEQEQYLFTQLERETGNPEKILAAYESYLARRDATYFHLETGESLGVDDREIEAKRSELYERAAGYERIAVDVMRAICTNQPTVMPVDVANQGAIPELEAHDAVEVPCVIDANGAHPLAVGRVPEGVRSLLLKVKEYERLTVQAAIEGSAVLAVDSLAANPLIRDRQQAGKLVAAYRAAHQPWLDYLQ